LQVSVPFLLLPLAMLFAVLARIDAVQLLELPVKMIRVFITNSFANFGSGEVRLLQKGAGMPDTHFIHVIVEVLAGFLFE
jgi:hypothetical protein